MPTRTVNRLVGVPIMDGVTGANPYTKPITSAVQSFCRAPVMSFVNLLLLILVTVGPSIFT